MKILTSGCSFTQWALYPGGPNTCWPRWLGELDSEYQIKNVGEAAAGNQFICDSVIREIIYNPKEKYDHVLVMWSGVSRLDFLTSIEDPAWSELLQSYGFFRIFPESGAKLAYIFSGGQMGTWFANKVAYPVFNEQYKISSEHSLATINIMEMIKLQSFLKARNIPYTFMSYVNYWNSDKHVSRNGDFGVFQFPELQPMINELDQSRFLFLNERRECIYDLAKQMDSFMDDRFHPGEAAHKAWAELIHRHLENSANTVSN